MEDGQKRLEIEELFIRFQELLAEEDHVIQFTDRGWTIAHPVKERLDGSLFECRIFWEEDDPGWRGKYWLLDDGSLGEPYRWDPHEGWA